MHVLARPWRPAGAPNRGHIEYIIRVQRGANPVLRTCAGAFVDKCPPKTRPRVFPTPIFENLRPAGTIAIALWEFDMTEMVAGRQALATVDLELFDYYIVLV